MGALAGLLILFFQNGREPARPSSGYAREIADFRAHQEQDIAGEDGWITLAGLHWLKPGINRVGSDSSLEVPLPVSAPAFAGTLTLAADRVVYRPPAGSPERLLQTPDDVVTFGRVKFFVISRGGKFAARVRDNDSPARAKFTHLKWYPPDPTWRIAAAYTPWEKPRTLTFDTSVPGIREDYQAPGFVTFARNGKSYRLEPALTDGAFFFVFRDRTAGKTTYAAARFLDAAPPRDGVVILDFNKAVNPPCVFTPYATCPLPPRQNVLNLSITAGELMYKSNDEQKY